MPATRIIPAIGTPLTPDEQLHEEGLLAQCERLWAAGIESLFVAGTLGAMPLLTDATYRGLVERMAELARGRCELLVGAGDTGFARTRGRIALLNRLDLDGVVVLPPYFMHFSQDDLIGYYHALADESDAPLYLYDLPQRTQTTLEVATVLRLAEHPNIAGIKCSGPIEVTRQLIDAVAERDARFRVIVAQPDLLDMLVRHGIREHLDGMYTLAPHWTQQIAQAVEAGNIARAQQLQQDLTALRRAMQAHGGLAALSVLMNRCGVPGHFAPRPFRQLTEPQQRALLAEPVVARLLATNAAPVPGA